MNEAIHAERLHRGISPLVDGIFIAAASLLQTMDAPGMSLEELRRSKAACDFRACLFTMRGWLEEAVSRLPAKDFTDEERRFLRFLFQEVDRAVAKYGREPAGDGQRVAPGKLMSPSLPAAED